MNTIIKSLLRVCYVLTLIVTLSLYSPAVAQTTRATPKGWRVALQRKDHKEVVFQLERSSVGGKTELAVLNAGEKIKITNVESAGDSLFFTMPAFEASFRVKMEANGNITGTFIKATAANVQNWPITGIANNPQRFKAILGVAKSNITGKWNVSITRSNGTIRKALAIFKQKGNQLTGTFLTPSADYRYLDGIVTGDSLLLSSFDGDNARLFEAKIDVKKNTLSGIFYNGYDGKENWIATKDSTADVPEISDPTKLREGYSHLDFTFNDLEGNPVSIKDEKYKNKVVIVQIMGSWCANCLDETRFLSTYYKENKAKGVEIIALAYEYTTDEERSKKSIERFKKLFDVQYPILITGATSSDDKKSEKTLPQLTAIKSFPTTIFIDKTGTVRDIHTNFYGPGSGQYYDLSKKRLIDTVNRLLAE
ncbi:MAG: TlpA family protein disulfide reductase [Bacteroidota bacterium]|nr:TlpA family protein disulfide reductase [Bacteroidota bacterium]